MEECQPGLEGEFCGGHTPPWRAMAQHYAPLLGAGLHASVGRCGLMLCPWCLPRFGDGYMITVRTKSSLNVKEVVRFFNRNFPEAILKVSLAPAAQHLYQPQGDRVQQWDVYSSPASLAGALGSSEHYLGSQEAQPAVSGDFACCV